MPCCYIQGPLELGNQWAAILSTHLIVHSSVQPTPVEWALCWARGVQHRPRQTRLCSGRKVDERVRRGQAETNVVTAAKQDDGREGDGAASDQTVGESLSEEGTFLVGPQGREGASHAEITPDHVDIMARGSLHICKYDQS